MSQPKNPRVLVFDSGVGGLSIIDAIQDHLPGCDLTYASDNHAFPYGTKDESELIDRVSQVLRRLLHHSPADVVVIACNTASTLALPPIRREFSLPIVGVVPAIKPAAAQSRTGVIGLLATPGTVARPYTADLIQEYAAGRTVISVGSSALVQLAEETLRGRPPSVEQLKPILEGFIQHPQGHRMDTLVLACTHFPLLRQPIAECLGTGVALIDSGEAIARRVAYWLDTLALEPGTQPSQHRCLFTRAGQDVERLRPILSQFEIRQVDLVSV